MDDTRQKAKKTPISGKKTTSGVFRSHQDTKVKGEGRKRSRDRKKGEERSRKESVARKENNEKDSPVGGGAHWHDERKFQKSLSAKKREERKNTPWGHDGGKGGSEKRCQDHWSKSNNFPPMRAPYLGRGEESIKLIEDRGVELSQKGLVREDNNLLSCGRMS